MTRITFSTLEVSTSYAIPESTTKRTNIELRVSFLRLFSQQISRPEWIFIFCPILQSIVQVTVLLYLQRCHATDRPIHANLQPTSRPKVKPSHTIEDLNGTRQPFDHSSVQKSTCPTSSNQLSRSRINPRASGRSICQSYRVWHSLMS